MQLASRCSSQNTCSGQPAVMGLVRGFQVLLPPAPSFAFGKRSHQAFILELGWLTATLLQEWLNR